MTFLKKQHSLQNVQTHIRHVAHGTAAAERELNSMAFKILSNAEIPCNIICYVCLKPKKAFYYIMVTPHKRHYANERWIFVMNNNVTIVLLIEALIAEWIPRTLTVRSDRPLVGAPTAPRSSLSLCRNHTCLFSVQSLKVLSSLTAKAYLFITVIWTGIREKPNKYFSLNNKRLMYDKIVACRINLQTFPVLSFLWE